MTEVLLPCGRVFLLDEADRPLLEGRVLFSEKRGKTWYVRTRTRGQQGSGIFLHRLILPVSKTKQVDHINGNGLDNRRENLRACTWRQNLCNTGPRRPHKKYKGVYFDQATEAWYVQLTANRHRIYGGRHETEEEAARAYDTLARKYFGEFAWLNFNPRRQHEYRDGRGNQDL